MACEDRVDRSEGICESRTRSQGSCKQLLRFVIGKMIVMSLAEMEGRGESKKYFTSVGVTAQGPPWVDLLRTHLSQVSLQPAYKGPILVFLNKGPSC